MKIIMCISYFRQKKKLSKLALKYAIAEKG